MKVRDAMTKRFEAVRSDAPIRDCAKKMQELDIGALPVHRGDAATADQLVGMVTDRDIVVRAVAEGRDPAHTHVGDIMTEGVEGVFEEEDVSAATERMKERQIRRLVVVDHDRKPVGVLSLGDIALHCESRDEKAETLEAVSR